MPSTNRSSSTVKNKTALKARYHHGDLRNALIDASLSLIQERGPKGFSLTEAARRAGVSVAAPYRHFQDKEALLAAIALQGTQLLSERMRAALTHETMDAALLIVAGAEAYVQFACEQPAYFRCMFGADLDKTKFPELVEAVQHALALSGPLLAALCAGQPYTMLQLQTISAELWAIVHGAAALVVDGAFAYIVKDVSSAELVRGAVLRYLQGLKSGEHMGA